MDTGNFELNLDKVKEKLNRINGVSNRDNHLWKPDSGEQKIRIVPYVHQRDFPFVELQWHYDLPGRSVISPVSFGGEDPVVEFAQALRRAGGDHNWKLSKKLMPKKRNYAPVIVRGEEDMGVRFYGFGVTIYKELLGFLADDDFGNFIDPVKGNDIKVEYIPRAQSSTNYPQTNIKLLPQQKPITTDKDVLERLFEDQPKIEDVFADKVASYEDLQRTLEEFKNADFDMERLQNKVRGTGGGSSAPSKSSTSRTGGGGSSSSAEESAVDADDLADELDAYFSN